MQNDIDYILANVFNHETETDERSEFWWRETVDREGYVMVWYDGDDLATLHTYRYPPDFHA